jgi:hypothetical protein
MEGRRERGELGRREGMEKGVARPNDISDTHRPAPYTGTNRGGKVNWEREGERERPCARRRGMARERPERMVPGRVAETES